MAVGLNPGALPRLLHCAIQSFRRRWRNIGQEIIRFITIAQKILQLLNLVYTKTTINANWHLCIMENVTTRIQNPKASLSNLPTASSVSWTIAARKVSTLRKQSESSTNTTKPARTDMAGKGFEPAGPETDDHGLPVGGKTNLYCVRGAL